MTTEADITEYNKWIDEVTKYIEAYPKKSYCLINYDNWIWEAPINYYAVNNPKKKSGC